MCGIVAAIAERDVARILIAGLKALEYRGYDSAGMVLDTGEELVRLRQKGKVAALEDLYRQTPVAGHLGIAHTRWATHGKPTQLNAHPHISRNDIAVVHNGIIENFRELKAGLEADGYVFETETDTEVIVHLLHQKMQATGELYEAVKQALDSLQGAYAIAAISRSQPDCVIGARKGSPLVVGLGIGENFLASDTHALLPVSREFIYLQEGDVVKIDRESVTVCNAGKEVIRESTEVSISADAVDRGQYRHYMLKEIHEQSNAASETMEGRITENGISPLVFGPDAESVFEKVERISFLACGTSYHACLVAKYWIEELARIPCQVEIASEFRYRKPVIQKNTLLVLLSQSGETADTLSALRYCGSDFLASLAICNVAESSLVRETDLAMLTRAGPEIGVASTKAFTSQLTALALLLASLLRVKGQKEKSMEICQQLRSLPEKISECLLQEEEIAALAERFADLEHALFLGRGDMYPIAMEGALKLKEISYIHAEAYAAGELKHGPLALVDEKMPVIAVAPNNELLDKIKSNLAEVQARGGELYVFAEKGQASGMPEELAAFVAMPECSPILHAMVYTIPLQLLAYHVALIKGTDVDHPRNLAKSVTVE